MMTFSTFLAGCGVGGGATRRMPKEALMSGFEKPPRGARSVRFGAALPRHECVIRDNARNLALRIVSEAATGLNLWNPGQEKRCPGVIPGDEWRCFVAVEPFAMGLNRFLVLAPGESHVLKMSVSAGIMKRQLKRVMPR